MLHELVGVGAKMKISPIMRIAAGTSGLLMVALLYSLLPHLMWSQFHTLLKQMSIAKTNLCPYYAVIFTSVHEEHDDAYSKMAEAMFSAAKLQPGYLGVETAGGDIGVTVSYWDSLDAISDWKQQAKHLAAQRLGREKWYRAYKVRICKVERDYEFSRDN